MLLSYHGQLLWVTRSCGLPYTQREIRYGRQQRSWRPTQMDSSGHLRRCSDADTSNKCLSRREIRYGRQQRSWRPTQTPHQVTYDVVATPTRPTNA
eukprot:scaffold14097_cov120-Skeletonema_dohrnii-CCMP3373.AAC.1